MRGEHVNKMNAYLTCFDISDDKIRYRVTKCLLAYGVRVQRSVFEISIESPAELEEIKRQVIDLVESGDDVRFYSICLNCRRKSHKHDGERIAVFPSFVMI